jgi:hypothetical protein
VTEVGEGAGVVVACWTMAEEAQAEKIKDNGRRQTIPNKACLFICLYLFFTPVLNCRAIVPDFDQKNRAENQR